MIFDSKNFNYIKVVRCFTTPDGLSRIGNLFINDHFFCNSLEPLAYLIPTGEYPLSLDVVSPKFQNHEPYRTFCHGKVPRILNVPCRDGILIHIGNFPSDSRGCILVGDFDNTRLRFNRIVNSRSTFLRLYGKLKSFKYPIKIIISDVRSSLIIKK